MSQVTNLAFFRAAIRPLLEARLMEGEIQRPETLNSPVSETSARNGAWRCMIAYCEESDKVGSHA